MHCVRKRAKGFTEKKTNGKKENKGGKSIEFDRGNHSSVSLDAGVKLTGSDRESEGRGVGDGYAGRKR